jgi:hypothetical protein
LRVEEVADLKCSQCEINCKQDVIQLLYLALRTEDMNYVVIALGMLTMKDTEKTME